MSRCFVRVSIYKQRNINLQRQDMLTDHQWPQTQYAQDNVQTPGADGQNQVPRLRDFVVSLIKADFTIAWFPYDMVVMVVKNRVTIILNGQIIIVYTCKLHLKNSLIIQEQNTKKNHKRVVSLYVIKNHVNLHKL
jgi:hypothetical protein